MDEHGVVGEGEMEAVVTGMPKHTNATVPRGRLPRKRPSARPQLCPGLGAQATTAACSSKSKARKNTADRVPRQRIQEVRTP